MDLSTPNPSPELQAANQRLVALRRQIQAQRQVSEMPEGDAPPGAPPWEAHRAGSSPDVVATIGNLPDHLGWGSTALTAVIRQQCPVDARLGQGPKDDGQAETAVTRPPGVLADPQPLASSQLTTATIEPAPDWVKLYPDIGLGMLRQEMTAPGRLWLMLRYMDREGCGVLRIDNVVSSLTQPTSPLHFCGKRQLRNLLRDGENIYWKRDKNYIWLRSAAKVAVGLEVERLTGRPVALPLTALQGGIGDFRAHLYTAFHSSRVKETPYGIQSMPVARDTLSGLSGVGRSSQRVYEARVGVHVQANFAVGEVSSSESREKHAWQQGQALFEIKDYRGQQGKRGRTYLAWQLPNSYVGQHQHRPKGRQKRINRELKDLVTKGTPGNGEETGETPVPEKRYYPQGKLAAVAYGRKPEQPHYWRRQERQPGHMVMWQHLGGF